jgi:hypothetical protein
MKDINKIRQELIDAINNDPMVDLSDIGNTIGIVVGKHLKEEMGFGKDDFLHGINHGISISNETHP